MRAEAFQPLRLTERNALRLRSSGLRVFMTGGSGWLGRATLEMLESAFPGPEFSQRVVAFGSRARPLTLRSGRQVLLLAQAEEEPRHRREQPQARRRAAERPEVLPQEGSDTHEHDRPAREHLDACVPG